MKIFSTAWPSAEILVSFCLHAVDPQKLKGVLGHLPPGLQELQGRSVGPFFPTMAVFPMGFNRAFHLAHQAHAELARRSLPEAGHLRDRHPAPRIGAGPGRVGHAMLIYADNNNHLGFSGPIGFMRCRKS